MTNVELLFEVRFYELIYLQGNYCEHIAYGIRCYFNINLIWKKNRVSKLLTF